MPYNFAAESFQRNFAQDFLRQKYTFRGKMVNLPFLSPPLGDLGATYAVHLRLIRKFVVDLLLVIIELFFARCFRFVMHNSRVDRQTAAAAR